MKKTRVINTETFINRVREVHSDKYIYTNVEYINSKTKVCIICPEHGEFWQLPFSHLQKHGCPHCNGGIKHTLIDFIIMSCNIHGDIYDYSLVEYINSSTKVCIICPIHGEFWQIPSSHLYGCGCPMCVFNLTSIRRSNSMDKIQFISKSKLLHNDIYDYQFVEYINSSTKVCVICPYHGEFMVTPNNHLRGRGCPICNSSHGERDVHRWLGEHNIKHDIEYTYDGLVGVGGGLLRFDFYLPDTNTCIEFDGGQHYDQNHYLNSIGSGYDMLHEHDTRKNEYCDKHNIRLIRINEDDDINDVLSNQLLRREQ